MCQGWRGTRVWIGDEHSTLSSVTVSVLPSSIGYAGTTVLVASAKKPSWNYAVSRAGLAGDRFLARCSHLANTESRLVRTVYRTRHAGDDSARRVGRFLKL